MELKVDITFDELLQAIQKLPEEQLSTLKTALSAPLKYKGADKDFEKLVLNGPVMTDDQYETYKENRKNFNSWRSN